MFDLEMKFARFGSDLTVKEDAVIEGYASVFGQQDQDGDKVVSGAYAKSLVRAKNEGRGIKMLWQHDPTQPIGIWDELREDARGLYVKGRLLLDVEKGKEAAALVAAGALDGLSIGYRTRLASKGQDGGRILKELDLWEVSLVTFPMLPSARIGSKSDPGPQHIQDLCAGDLATVFQQMRDVLITDC